MTNINLYQSPSDHELKRDGTAGFFDAKFFLSIGMVLIAGLGSLGIWYYNGNLTKENAALASELADEESKGFSGSVVSNVVDFQTRLDQIKTKVDGTLPNTKLLDTLAKAFIPGVRLDTYVYESKTGRLQLKLWAANYRTIAAQLLNFKVAEDADANPKVKNFNQVEISEIKRTEKGIEFSISMSVNFGK